MKQKCIYAKMHDEVENSRKALLKKANATIGDIVRLFPNADTEVVELNDLSISNKTAIVLLGLSVTGKTTFANMLKKQNDFLTIVSMDDCARRLYQFGIMDEELNNTASVQVFGEQLEHYSKINQPIIVDGLWVNIYPRIALFKTLRKIGYEICVIDFITNYDSEAHKDKMMKRALDLLAWKRLIEIDNIKFVNQADSVYDNATMILATRLGITEYKLIERLMQEDEYVDILSNVYNDSVNEVNDNLVSMQKSYDLFKIGADLLVTF